MPATKLPSAVLYIILPLSGILVFFNALIVALKLDKKMLPGAEDAGKEEEHG